MIYCKVFLFSPMLQTPGYKNIPCCIFLHVLLDRAHGAHLYALPNGAKS